MAFIPWFRVIIFILVTLISIVVLGLAAYWEWLLGGVVNIYTYFAPLAIATSFLTMVTLPLFLALGNLQSRACTSTIVFELIWFLILMVFWAATAGSLVANYGWFWPTGCSTYDLYGNYIPQENTWCIEYTIIEALSFVNFVLVLIYYKFVLWYSIISAFRGRRIWTLSVKEAATGVIKTGGSPGLPIATPQFVVMPQGQVQNFGTYPANVAPAQVYNTVPQQVVHQGSHAQMYNAVPQQVVPQGSPAQPFGASYVVYPGQMPPQSPPVQYTYVSAPGSPQPQVVAASPVSQDPTVSSMPVQGQHVPQHPNLPSPYQA